MLPESSPVCFLAILLVLVILSLQVILSGADVAVETSSQWADEDSNHAVTCTPSEAIRFLRWFKSSTNEEFADAQLILRLFVLTSVVTFDPSVNASHYSFDKSASDYPLTINGVGFDDEVTYWCEVELSSSLPNQNGKTSFQVRRIPASIVLKHADMSYNNESEAVVIVGKNQFECYVPNIKPAARFTWKLGSEDLHSFDERNETNEDTRFVNSYSTLTATVSTDSELTCSAQNKQDGTTTPDQTITIMLKTRADPCSGGPCKNGGTCSPTADSFQCTCVDGYEGETCEDDTEKTTPPMRSLTTGAIVGIACAGLVLMVGTCVLVYCCCCGNKRKSDKPKEPHGDHESNTPMDTK